MACAVAPGSMKKRRKQVVTPNDETLDGGGVKPITRWKASVEATPSTALTG